MKNLCRWTAVGALAIVSAAGSVFACGTPPTEPPQPPAPPVVCCKVVSWFIDCSDPSMQCVILRYFREDGLPLFTSFPMPVTSGQQCACGLSPISAPPGVPSFPVMDMGLSFGTPAGNPCDPLPGNVPGYNRFGVECNTNTLGQIDSFFNIFYSAAGITRVDVGGTTDGCLPQSFSRPYSFRGPTTIPPGVTFDVYRKICFPVGIDPSFLCSPATGGLSAIGVFLVNNGQVFIEPSAPGGTPISFQQFQQTGGRGAIYKVKCLPFDLLEPCNAGAAPAVCRGDANGDGLVNFDDVSTVLGNFGLVCP